jgi:hypothetical protein
VEAAAAAAGGAVCVPQVWVPGVGMVCLWLVGVCAPVCFGADGGGGAWGGVGWRQQLQQLEELYVYLRLVLGVVGALPLGLCDLCAALLYLGGAGYKAMAGRWMVSSPCFCVVVTVALTGSSSCFLLLYPLANPTIILFHHDYCCAGTS